jgi:hypothetical protein
MKTTSRLNCPKMLLACLEKAISPNTLSDFAIQGYRTQTLSAAGPANARFQTRMETMPF